MANILFAESNAKNLVILSASEESQKKIQNRDSSLRASHYAQNDNVRESADSAIFSDSALDSAFVLNPALLNQKTLDFINQTSLELFEKTGVKLYVFSSESLQNDNQTFETYEQFKADFIAQLNAPFVAIIVIKNNKKIDIIASNDEILPKNARNKIYWEYIVPLLPQKEEVSLMPAIFNGYVEAVDLIADNFGVKINHNISKNEKGANLVAKGILYIMLFSMLGLVALIYLFRNKRK